VFTACDYEGSNWAGDDACDDDGRVEPCAVCDSTRYVLGTQVLGGADSLGSSRVDVCHGSATRSAVANFSVLQREECEITTEAHVLTWVDASSDLANENRTGRNRFAAEGLHPAPLAITIATVA